MQRLKYKKEILINTMWYYFMNKMNEHMKIMNHELVCRQQSLLTSRFHKYVLYGTKI